MTGPAPSLKVEQSMLATGHRLLAAADEVGRGALGGPVSVGLVVIDAEVRRAPRGVRDSKLLSPAAREALVPRLRSWATAYAVGHATAAEIDAYGILRALRLAGERALAIVQEQLDELPGCVLLDGNYDWFRRPARVPQAPRVEVPAVTTMVKADLRCAAVAAASVLAKVERDGLMTELAVEYPGYGWDENRGYATPLHLAALREIGPCEQHRRSWRLPGLDEQLSLTLD